MGAERKKMTNIFFAISDADIAPLFFDKTGIKCNYLMAFNNIKNQSWKLTNLYRKKINLLYLDSGAYASSTRRSCAVSRDRYLDHLRGYGHKYDEFFNLDDNFNDPVHNQNNQHYLENGLGGTGMKPIPVVHDKTDPFGEFSMYANMGHQYIAIGSSGSRKGKDKLLTQAKNKYPEVKIHLFGDLDKYLLEKHRPYSADSASWAHQAGVGGGIYYWRPQEKKQYQFNIGGRNRVNGKTHIKLSPLWNEIEDFLYNKFGYDHHDLFNYKCRFILNIYAIKQYEDYLNSV